MSNLTILRKYAQTNPEKLPRSILFSYSQSNVVVYDYYPKSTFHFLVLPRIHSHSASVSTLTNLRTLLQGDKEEARKILLDMNATGSEVCREIEVEMQRSYGRVWPIRRGFHAVPSMQHLHLHVLSDDLVSERLKNKKHYNSFHPKLGFFLDMDEVLGWFDAHPSYYKKKAELNPKDYELLLKQDMTCWRCEITLKNMPTLKEHLQKHFDDDSNEEKAKQKRKADLDDNIGGEKKKMKTSQGLAL